MNVSAVACRMSVALQATSTFIAPGVVVQAVLGTMAVLAGVLIAYRLRWIRVTRRFAGFAAAAATGLLLLLAADLLFSAFGAESLGFGSGGLGAAFGVAGVLIGGAFLALDFQQVEDGIARGLPGRTRGSRPSVSPPPWCGSTWRCSRC